MTTAVAPAPLLSAEEFARRPDPGHPEELVRGRIVAMPPPNQRHGQVCMQAVRILDRFIGANDLGQLLINDAGVITERDPDSVRGPDISFYSHERQPRGIFASAYGTVMPELVGEVRSPGNSWPDIYRKIGEFLDAGVLCVVILEPEGERAYVARSGGLTTLGPDDELTLPDILPGFAVRVGQFFA